MNHMECRDCFKKRLNGYIKRTFIKVVTLSKLTGVSVSQVNRWTNGELMPTWEQFSRLLDIFGVSSDEMLGEAVSKNRYNKMFK